MKICVAIPAYNEAKTIGELVKSVKAYCPDVIVINDGSVDATEAASMRAGATVISLKENVGKGTALKAGLKKALESGYDAVVTMDADGQHLPGDLLNIIDAAEASGAGVVVGNRMADPEDMPLTRFVTNLFMSFIISMICRQNIPDTQCGFRLIRCDALKKMRLISSNYEIESEMLIKASKAGFKIISVPVKSVYQGELSLINPFLDTWRFFVMLIRILV